MNPPRVYVICVNRLVCEVVHLLLRREGVDSLGIETDPETALIQIRALNPDIVLVEDDGNPHETGLMKALARLTYENEHLRIIRLSLTDEALHIYHQEQRRLVNTQDLVAAIRAA